MSENRLARIDREVARLGAIAPGGYLLALRIRGTSPLQAWHTYPQAWIDEYTQNGYMLRDPLMTWALAVGGTIRWSSPLLPDPFGIFRKAAAHGLRFGASIAHGPLRALTICSMGRGDREFTDAEIAAAREIVLAVHEASALPERLEEAEARLLAALAAGEGEAAIAARLGLPRREVAARIDALCGTLVARSPREAVQRGRDHGFL
ncbi:autoinducer binding domain-containing protein, partial [Albidovulum sp.]